MTVKIVTDSGADLPQEIIKDLGISVVPLHIIFDEKSYRDGIDISADELYQKLVSEQDSPTTSTASPGEFAEIYRKILDEEAETIVSIHLTSKLSKVYESALQGKELVEVEIRERRKRKKEEKELYYRSC